MANDGAGRNTNWAQARLPEVPERRDTPTHRAHGYAEIIATICPNLSEHFLEHCR